MPAPDPTTPANTTSRTVPTSFGDVPVTVTDRGQGRPVLLLHGGAGPDSVNGFADMLAARYPLRVLTPVHPGFGGTVRPDALNSMPRLAELYLNLLDQLGLAGVTVAGSSIGGWIAAETALRAATTAGSATPAGSAGLVERLILLDAAGLDSAEYPIADFFSLTLDQVAELSWAHPEGHQIDLSVLTDAQQAVFAGNRAALETYGGRAMADPALAARLGGIAVPTLVIWGEADRIVTPDYGKQYAAAIPGASFQLMPDAGHLPQLETPEPVATALTEFIGVTAG
jgi:pimeloyl-ACP methyl ester carboxylesterase